MQRCAQQGGLPALTAPTYGSMIKAYGQANNAEKVWALWSEMKERGVGPTAITLGCIVDVLVKTGSRATAAAELVGKNALVAKAAHLSVCLSVGLSVCLSVCLFICSASSG